MHSIKSEPTIGYSFECDDFAWNLWFNFYESFAHQIIKIKNDFRANRGNVWIWFPKLKPENSPAMEERKRNKQQPQQQCGFWILIHVKSTFMCFCFSFYFFLPAIEQGKSRSECGCLNQAYCFVVLYTILRIQKQQRKWRAKKKERNVRLNSLSHRSVVFVGCLFFSSLP